MRAVLYGLDAGLLRFDGTLSGRFSPVIYVLVALVASFAGYRVYKLYEGPR